MMMDWETFNHFICVLVKRPVCQDWEWGYFHNDLKKPQLKPCMCAWTLLQNSHKYHVKIAYQFSANDLFKVTLCQLVLLRWLNVATFLLYHSNVLAFILPHICIYSFSLDLQLFAKNKPPKGLYVYGDVGKFQLHNLNGIFSKCRFIKILKRLKALCLCSIIALMNFQDQFSSTF